eukprot:347075-Chlamydomonas_euryale.AAC.4
MDTTGGRPATSTGSSQYFGGSGNGGGGGIGGGIVSTLSQSAADSGVIAKVCARMCARAAAMQAALSLSLSLNLLGRTSARGRSGWTNCHMHHQLAPQAHNDNPMTTATHSLSNSARPGSNE